MESRLHQLIRLACGGTWNAQASAIWDAVQNHVDDNLRMLESANARLRKHNATLEARIAVIREAL